MNRNVEAILRLLWSKGHIKGGDRVIVTMGDTLGKEGGTNTLRLVQLGEDGDVENQSNLDLH